MCGEHFNSAEIWCEIHVEGGECKFYPWDLKGKSRIKNRLKKQIQKNKMIDPELVPFASKVLEEVEQERQRRIIELLVLVVNHQYNLKRVKVQ